MRDLKYYKKAKKSDTHNHLNLSMSYYRYKKWAGFTIPHFPRKMNGLEEMHSVIAEYTRPRCKTREDVIALLEMSILSAISDNVVLLEGSVDMNFIRHFDEDIDALLSEVQNLVKKYKEKITLVPELGISKTLDRSFLKKWTLPLISSGVFKNVDLYGPEVSEGIEDFVYIFELAGKHGLKKKAHVGEFSDAMSVKQFVECFSLDEVQHGIGAANDDSVLQFLADRKIRCNVCPASNVGLQAVPSLREHPIAKMMRAGVPVGLGTDDLMFFGKTNSMQLYELVSSGVITEEEADILIGVR